MACDAIAINTFSVIDKAEYAHSFHLNWNIFALCSTPVGLDFSMETQ